MAEDEKQAGAGPEQTVPDVKKANGSTKARTVIRVLVFVVLALLVIVVVQWAMLRNRYEKAAELYENGSYEAASKELNEIINSALSVFRVRAQARDTLGKCRLEMAKEIEQSGSSVKQFQKALGFLKEAESLGVQSDSIKQTRDLLEARKKAKTATESDKPVKGKK